MKTASELMTPRFLRISTDHTLREALGLVLHGESKGYETAAIVVINYEGELAGILTHEAIIRGITGAGSIDDLPEEQIEFLARVESHFDERVSLVMNTAVPRIAPETPLAELIHKISRGKHECLPVIEADRVVGLVFASDVFLAAADLALTNESEDMLLEK